MSCPLEVKNIYVTSTNRDVTKDPFGNSYTLYLTTPIKDIKTVELLYASVPNTVYNIESGLGVVTFPTTGSLTTPSVTSNIAPGFYNPGSLATAMNNARPSTAAPIVVTFLSSEFKFLFLYTSPFTINVSPEISQFLGFNKSGDQESIDARNTPFLNDSIYTGKHYIKSDSLIEPHAIDGIFLDIQELRTMYNECKHCIFG